MTGIVAQNVGRTSGLIKAASGGGGAWTSIKTLTASDDATLTFTNGSSDVVFDSTYPIYLFKFINIDNATTSTGITWQFQSSTNASDYNIACTNTNIQYYHVETGAYSAYEYNTSHDHAQDTGFIKLNSQYLGAEADGSCCGEVMYFSPSSTVFVKHYLATTQYMHTSASNSHTWGNKTAGYFNTASAITSLQFKFSSGNISAGQIKLYGLKDSA